MKGLIGSLEQSKPVLPPEYQRTSSAIDGLIDDMIERFESLKTKHQEHIEKHLASHRRHEGLRQQLLKQKPLEMNATGSNLKEMLGELKGVNKSSPYLISNE